MRNNSDSNMGLDNDLIMSIESKNSKMKSQLKSQVKNKRKTTISIESEIDLKFRKIAASKFNFSQGWYTKAVNEAFKEWIEHNEEYFKLE